MDDFSIARKNSIKLLTFDKNEINQHKINYKNSKTIPHTHVSLTCFTTRHKKCILLPVDLNLVNQKNI